MNFLKTHFQAKIFSLCMECFQQQRYTLNFPQRCRHRTIIFNNALHRRRCLFFEGIVTDKNYAVTAPFRFVLIIE